MSRLIVKNLPKKITEDKIREVFGEIGTITDVQLKYTPEGKFRNFGFIGFQTEAEAEQAINSLNNTFINTNRITVEKCALLGDANKPKSWSKYAPDSTAYKKTHEVETVQEKPKPKKEKKKKKDEVVELLAKYKDDPMFEEFLQVHAPDETEKLHSLQVLGKNAEDNDSAIDSGKESPHEESDQEEDDSNKLANQEISDMEYMKKLMNKDTSEEKKPSLKTEKMAKQKIELFNVKVSICF